MSALKLETRLNGKRMQSTSTADLVFSVPRVIEYFSKFYELRPGDLITTGSPSGVGYGRTPLNFYEGRRRHRGGGRAIGVPAIFNRSLRNSSYIVVKKIQRGSRNR